MATKGVLGQVWGYVNAEKKWWLMPILLVLLAAGIVLVYAQGSALAPFIYAIF